MSSDYRRAPTVGEQVIEGLTELLRSLQRRTRELGTVPPKIPNDPDNTLSETEADNRA